MRVVVRDLKGVGQKRDAVQRLQQERLQFRNVKRSKGVFIRFICIYGWIAGNRATNERDISMRALCGLCPWQMTNLNKFGRCNNI